ncbi:MAG: HAD-IA family hydrolase [Endomicrobium sp.]|nr:HAD-IA family hydrolase [Endomicrobium sp.]
MNGYKNMSFDFLIFDLDGTLVNSQEDLTFSVNCVRKDYGFEELSVEQVRSYLGSGMNALMSKAVPDISSVSLQEIVEKFKFYYGQHLTDKTVLFEGVEEMLRALKSKKKAILSNKTEKFSCEILKRLNIFDYFIKVWGGDSIDVKKPDPRTVLDLIKLTESDISKTVMIGDSANDFLVAKSAGIPSIAALYGFSDKHQIKQHNPDFVVETARDIVDIV